MSNGLQPGNIYHRKIDGMMHMDYFVYVPQNWVKERILFTIHGISRNAEEHVQRFSNQAEKYGSAIIAPLFTKNNFAKYQQLGTTAKQERADMAFDQVRQDVYEWLEIGPTPMCMFGFSGGGQFLHRYALFYPKRVARMVLTAPGWYTFPDPERRYPFGIKSTKDWPGLKFDLDRFLRIPTLLMVGEDDDLRDKDLNKNRRIDAFQGLNRIERAERWTGSLSALARSFGVKGDHRLEHIPNASHAFESYIAHPPFAEKIFTFLFET